MARRFFLDTNILIYSFDERFPVKRHQAGALVEKALRNGAGIISYQVVQECLHLMTRKFEHRIARLDTQTYLEQVLMPLCIVFPDRDLYSDALRVSAETGWTYYDSLIVSAAAAANCDVLVTEDLQNGRTIRGVTIQNPFK
jgi:predicted nucleic acid-binding protein